MLLYLDNSFIIQLKSVQRECVFTFVVPLVLLVRTKKENDTFSPGCIPTDIFNTKPKDTKQKRWLL